MHPKKHKRSIAALPLAQWLPASLVAVALLLSVLPLVCCFLQARKNRLPDLTEAACCAILFLTSPP